MSVWNEIALAVLDTEGVTTAMWTEIIPCALSLSGLATIVVLMICMVLFESFAAQFFVFLICFCALSIGIWRKTIQYFKKRDGVHPSNKSN